MFVFFLLLLITTSTAAVLIAYEKVQISALPNTQKQVRHLVQGLPLMPKTPKFLLEKTALSHQQNKKNSFNMSLSLDSPELTQLLNLPSLNFQTKGAIDYTNPDEERRPWNDRTIIPSSINGKTDDIRVGKPWNWDHPPHK